MTERVQEARTQPRCPICGKPRSARYRPFCSARCADVDLNRWLSGRYVIATPADEDGLSSGGVGREGED